MLGIDADEDFQSSGRELVPFDAALPSLHAYLGDCADLSNTCERCLADGFECLLPVLSFNELVVTPGCSLPLLVSNSRAHWALEQALSAPAPLTGLLAVVLREEGQGQAPGRRRMGCSARIKKLQRHDNGPWPATLTVIAEGCQRLEVLEPTSHLSWRVRICADLATPRLPKEALEGRAHWARWAWRLSDPWELAAKATKMFSDIFPDVRVARGDPVEVSYWLTRNMPLGAGARQELLAAHTVVQRLRTLCAALAAKARTILCCRVCNAQLAYIEEVLAMTDDGTGGLFVNPSGYVHDVVAVRCSVDPRAERMSLMGVPSLQHSWFPGYAWTIANCSACGSHLGWHFLASEQQLPQQFYGLRRQALAA